MDYVKIPQNIRIEDKLIGPLSLRQIIIIAVGGGVSYTLYAMLNKTYGAVPPAAHLFIWLPLIFFAAIALVRINDISLTRYALLTFELMVKPRRRVFQPRRGLDVLPRAATSKKGKKEHEEEVKSVAKKPEVKIKDLSALMDRGSAGTETMPAAFDGAISAQIAADTSDAEVEAHGRRLEKMWQEMKTGRSQVSS